MDNESPPPSVAESSLEDSSSDAPTPPASGRVSSTAESAEDPPDTERTGTTVRVRRTQPVSPLLRQGSLGAPPPPGFEMSSLTLSDSPTPPPARYFAVPFTEGNIPVEIAKCFMDTYYPSITHGQQDELILHFAPEAQKSLSVGGAHAFCDSKQSVLQQLQSLHGSYWDVRGVVAQPGFMETILILINGVTLPKNQPQPLIFSHSITLVKSENGYQIHNDAMALIAGEH